MKFCPKCSSPLEGDAMFCSNCGSRIEAEAPAAEAPVQQPEYPNYGGQSYGQQPPYGGNAPYGGPSPYDPYGQGGGYQRRPVAPPNPYDHTSEFDAKDISENKVICMLIYLSSFIGVIIALLAGSSSPYVAFHLRQGLKFFVVNMLLGLVAGILAITVIVPIAAAIMIVVMVVLQIICFFQVCGGKAIEAPIIRSLGFLN